MASMYFTFFKRLFINAVTYFGIAFMLILLLRGTGSWNPFTVLLLISVITFVLSVVHSGMRDLGLAAKISFFLLSATSLPVLLFPVFQYYKHIDIVHANLNVSVFLSMMTYALATLITYLGFVSYLEARKKVTLCSLLAWYSVTFGAGYFSLLILVVSYHTFGVDHLVLFETWKWISSVIYLVVATGLFVAWMKLGKRTKKNG